MYGFTMSLYRIVLGVFCTTALGASTVQKSAATSGKPSIAVMSLRNASGVTADDAELLSDRLRIELFNTGQFAVMERSQMQEILKEQGFQQSGACSDEGCMVEMGQILGVNYLVGGSIGKLGTMYLVNIRSIDIQTGRITAVVSEDIAGGIESVVACLKVIAAKLAGKPSATGQPSASSPPPERKIEQTPSPQPPSQQSQPETDPNLRRCKEKVYLERPSFTAAQFGFSLSDDEMRKLNDEIASDLEKILDECLYGDVVVAAPEQISALDPCRAIVIRVRVLSYSTTPGQRNQVKGTAEVALEFYDGTRATTPYHTELIKATGAQHWGEYEPFENVFEEIAEILEKHDTSKQYMRITREKIRKL